MRLSNLRIGRAATRSLTTLLAAAALGVALGCCNLFHKDKVLPDESAVQTVSSGAMWMPCAFMNTPSPQDRRKRPSRSNTITGFGLRVTVNRRRTSARRP